MVKDWLAVGLLGLTVGVDNAQFTHVGAGVATVNVPLCWVLVVPSHKIKLYVPVVEGEVKDMEQTPDELTVQVP